ncbi:MAG: NAD(P)H oxidoreductase YrkL @ Putative NADPH-quinone reductase (modulator of drug activity B) @ Flavodoxin 2 [uncultured Arthrobacter sp.]|uniref:NAD(P)H oxidoreductase YrkL @ Putative NADPH-quinone reductase (Modulator of drug activity B) @ Flavodoxin 2 n=1 Tax=uncultured Arthrobacter sp. TaxID=114050 RepID=A0A6J4J9S6_9MICC|nr:NAD(P)H-dependent oxidoreductase [uncultured Arthrobacter sp.]CAA9270608.1 MAG: NAD(P)H oxidoreductase YrkL @ Putative NADPH-quinone reductase (modulator of drug activity B) @ Flavodoxin 2 [uncultured Arthrobacter sp.]
MHILTVYSHPTREHFPAAVLDAFVEGVVQAGHTAEVADLQAENFDPRFTAADHAHFWGGPRPADAIQEATRVEAADAIALVFPVYWWSFPALLKGWIDRVFTAGWAYSVDPETTTRGLLGDKPIILIGIGGMRDGTYDKYGYRTAMETQIDVGIFGFVGLTDVETHLLLDVEGDVNAERRADLLVRARAIGTALVAPDRAPRTARHGALRLAG